MNKGKLTTTARLEMSRCRKSLEEFFRSHPSIYERLFSLNEPIFFSNPLLEPLAESGLVTRVDRDCWISNYTINYLDGLFIVTDRFTSGHPDRVFPVSIDESIHLARKLEIHQDDVVLDLGTGSGIQALYAAKQARRVIATDINGKALQYAGFNAALNGLDEKIEFVSSDVFYSLGPDLFDLIVCNPPVIPAPPGSGFFIHSDGGSLGLNVSEKILCRGPEYLKPDGRIQMLATCFSGDNGKYVLFDLISGAHYKSSFEFHIDELYAPALEPLSGLTERFSHLPAYWNWKAQIKGRGFQKLHYLYIEMRRSSAFRLEHKLISRPFAVDAYNGSWEGRLARLFLAYNKLTPSGDLTPAVTAL